jgi:hypothetical protein
VLKKTAATGGLLIAAATGALVTCSPAFAAPAVPGNAQTHLATDHTRNWNGTENESFNHIRLHLNNRNNNIAVARNPNRNREEHRRPRMAPTVTVAPAVG